MGYFAVMSDDALPAEPSRSDRDDDLFVEPDDDVDLEVNMIDADLALREAGGDADRAEEILEAQRRPTDQRDDVPADERPV
jgi:hypothetical protein